MGQVGKFRIRCFHASITQLFPEIKFAGKQEMCFVARNVTFSHGRSRKLKFPII